MSIKNVSLTTSQIVSTLSDLNGIFIEHHPDVSVETKELIFTLYNSLSAEEKEQFLTDVSPNRRLRMILDGPEE